MKKRLYKWHRTISLIIALPVVLWAASGFMHPIMTTIRPKLATQWLPPRTIDTGSIKISLSGALQKNGIDKFSNTRIVGIGGQQFYQVQLPGELRLQYFSTLNGKRLPKGDELYARYLARQFLEGVHTTPAAGLTPPPAAEETDDCCRNAAAAVLDEPTGVKVNGVVLTTQFDNEYKYINRLLPVYKVSFDREDGIRIYVETGQDRFAFAMDNKRAVFDRLFTFFHTLGWLDALGRFKHVVEGLIMAMAFFTTVMGLCIFFSTKTKRPQGNALVKARRNHRWTSVVVSLFTLMFTFSGGYHAFSKLAPDDTGRYCVQNIFHPEDVQLDIGRLQSAIGPGQAITNIGLVKYNGVPYWQVYQSASAPLYVKAAGYSLLDRGEEKYAQCLATVFSGHAPGDIIKTERITKFTDEYGFVNKRLPVWKISYQLNGYERYYVETSTGRLGTRINDAALVEGYSFALLHKHEFMAWAGKPAKDFSTMFWAAAQLAMVTVGLLLWARGRKRKKAGDGRLEA